MKRLAFILFITLGLISLGQTGKNDLIEVNGIKIQWIENLKGDFSFVSNWTYPEGIYRNEFDQLSCDGICPPEIDKMKDENGKIFNDSMESFYKLIDTTHQYQTIECDAWCYEWSGTNFITFQRKNKDTIKGFTHANISTHCSLVLILINDKCFPAIELHSITNPDLTVYECDSGYIKIDKNKWSQGIIKAEFNFDFKHKENPKQPIYWKGKIYAKNNSIVQKK